MFIFNIDEILALVAFVILVLIFIVAIIVYKIGEIIEDRAKKRLNKEIEEFYKEEDSKQ